MLHQIAPVAARSLLLLAVAVLLSGFGSLFAPSADLWERWLVHDPRSRLSIDHEPWQRLLETYLHPRRDRPNRFAYAEVTAPDRRALDAYIAGLAGQPVRRLARAEQRAYWINLYNALTVQLVLDHYPVASIRDIDISPGLFADGPWDKALLEVEGRAVTLNDIEHRILRPIWRDPRLHYALNCASLGCPDLLPRAFTAANAEALLDAAARAYVNDPRGARVASGTLVVSSIYYWFSEDFGGGEAGVRAHLTRYAEPDLAAAIAVTTAIDHAYDWRLNDLAP